MLGAMKRQAPPSSIRVVLPGKKVIEVNLSRELAIDTNDLRTELNKQPAKYAMIATLTDLAFRKLDGASKALHTNRDGCSLMKDHYDKALAEYLVLAGAKEAFIHRKTALLGLWDDPSDPGVLREYQRNLSNLGHEGLRAV